MALNKVTRKTGCVSPRSIYVDRLHESNAVEQELNTSTNVNMTERIGTDFFRAFPGVVYVVRD